MRKLLLVLVACAVGVAFSLGFATRGHGTGRADCASLVVPVNSDHNLSYDPQTGALHIEYYGRAGHTEDANVDANSAACQHNPGVARAIAHARAAAQAVHDAKRRIRAVAHGEEQLELRVVLREKRSQVFF